MVDQMGHLGRLLIMAGVALVVVGALLVAGGRVPWLGRLPGDIVIERKNFTLYLPRTTSIILSLLLSVALWIIGRK
jgi:Protein of unknown function (DUF2905)